MREFKLSGFADEIDDDFEKQCLSLRTLGMDYIALRSIGHKNILDFTVEEFKQDVYPILCKYNLRVSSIGSPVGKVSIHDEEAQESQLGKLDHLIQIMLLLNTRYLRIFSLYTKSHHEEDLKRVVSFIKRVMARVEHHNIIVLHENEKDIYGDRVRFCEEIVMNVNHPQFMVAFDPANFVQVGDDPMVAFNQLKSRIADFHLKDAVYGSGDNVLIGSGDGKILSLLAALKSMSYDGFYTLEPHLYKFQYLSKLESNREDKMRYEDGFQAFKASQKAFFHLFQK